jgi:hypothetical protein
MSVIQRRNELIYIKLAGVERKVKDLNGCEKLGKVYRES